MFTTDHFFLIYFFPIFLVLYFLVHKKISVANIFIIIASALFYASFKASHLLYLFLLIPVDYYIAQQVYYAQSQIIRKLLVLLHLLISLGLLAYFKYIVFIVDSVQHLPYFSDSLIKVPIALIVPVGISFLTFQRISYVIDVYRKKIKPSTNLVEYTVYASYFPHLIAGPIVRYSEVKSELSHRSINFVTLYEAIKYIGIGLTLKMFIADRIYLLESDLTSILPELTAPLSFLLLLSFTLRIYFDFLGYSLLAIGLAKCAGFDFSDNFNSPYRATSLQDFWRRWNITLSSWLRDYLYIPLGGNKKGTARTYLNLILTMLLAGLWHGASWSFIIWGGLHGLGLVLERIWKQYSKLTIPTLISQLLTFGFVMVSWIPFKFNKLSESIIFIHTFKNLNLSWPTIYLENRFYITLPILTLGVIWILYGSEIKIKQLPPKSLYVTIFSTLLIFGLWAALLRKGVPFIYFQF